MIKMTPVQSSNVSRVGHDGKETLLIQYGDMAAVYQYTGVPVNIFESLLESTSVGKFVSQQIKPKYACKKITLPETQTQSGEFYVTIAPTIEPLSNG